MGSSYSRPRETLRLTKEFSDICRNAMVARTGDVILFGGNTWESWVIEWWTWCQYSHAAIVIRGHDLRSFGVQDDEAYLLESVGHADKVPVVAGKTGSAGVRIVRFADRVRDYQAEDPRACAKICIIQMNYAIQGGVEGLDTVDRAYRSGRLAIFAMHCCGMAYDRSMAHLFESALSSNSFPALLAHSKVSTDSFPTSFQCADLVVYALYAMGILTPRAICSSFVPKHLMYIPSSDYAFPLYTYLSNEHYHICVVGDSLSV